MPLKQEPDTVFGPADIPLVRGDAPPPAAMTETMVDVRDPLPELDGVQILSDGSVEIDVDGMGDELIVGTGTGFDPTNHYTNLAEAPGMTEGVLDGIAQEIVEWVEADIQARSQWQERLADGLMALGVVPEKDAKGPFKLTEKINHPAIAEAVTQFQARASAELLPPQGPAKGAVLGDRTKALEEQAERVADYENYQLMVEDNDWFDDTERMFHVLSLNGSQFKKIYRDPLQKRNVSRWVRGEDFIVPYGAASLATAPRFTHQIAIEQNDMKKLMASGFYRDVELVNPTKRQDYHAKLQEAKDKSQGQEDVSNDMLGDLPHTVFETYVDYDLKGFEDKDKYGEPTGIGLPYIISVDSESKKVLSIRRNWDETDVDKNKEINFVHYPYLPGEGFYSFGLIHYLGGSGKAATALLRIALLGAAFASLQGGFKSKDAKLPSDVELEFGKWQDTEMTAQELRECFYTPPFKEPGESLFKLLGLIEDGIRRFGSTTESMVGDASNTGPVGTTVALIEQGSKVFSGIHKRLHIAQGQELRILAKLNGRYVPQGGYPYHVKGASRMIYASDFSDRVDVEPVSDPNIFSSTQRIAIAQSVADRAKERPDLYNAREAEIRLLQALRVPDADKLVPDKSKVARRDPVSENALILIGRPVRAYQDQHHPAHIQLHMDQLRRLEAEQSPLLQQIAPIIMAHVAEHMAFSYRMQMMMQMGIQLPALAMTDEEESESQALPPEIENSIAARAAQVIASLPAPQTQQDQAAAEQQAQALDQQRAELEKAKAEIEQAKGDVDKERMNLDFAKREQALRDQLRQAHETMRNKAATDQQKAVLDEAVKRVEAALQAGTA